MVLDQRGHGGKIPHNFFFLSLLLLPSSWAPGRAGDQGLWGAGWGGGWAQTAGGGGSGDRARRWGDGGDGSKELEARAELMGGQCGGN